MKQRFPSLAALTLALVVGCCGAQAADAPMVLVTVGPLQITAAALEQAVTSSPFATKFNTLDEDQQAALRGSLLQRLVLSRLLLLEAEAQGLEQSEDFRNELQDFRLGLLHRRYMDRLRAAIEIPDAVEAQMKAQFKDDYDAFKAAQSAYIANRYKQARIEEIKRLRKRYRVQVYEDRIVPNAAPETVLLEGDGIRIRYADLPALTAATPGNAESIRDRLYARAELLLTARAAVDAGIDIDSRLAGFRDERLPALLLERLELQWLPDEAPLRAYFEQHPELGRILERRHVGQIVLPTREEAEAVRARILAGESLFVLAGEYSIDPYGREHKGDMGWVREDRGHPAINQAIAELPDSAVSEIVQTPMGFHIVTILERKPGEQRSYEQVRDKVRQRYLDQRLQAYLAELEQKYRVVWRLPDREAAEK